MEVVNNLVIINATLNDTGDYLCKVSNLFGTSYKNFTLKVEPGDYQSELT